MIYAKLRKLVYYFHKGGVYEVLLRLTAGEYLPEWLLYFSEAQVLCLDGPVPHAGTSTLSDYQYKLVDRGALDELLACSGPTTPATRRGHFEDFFDHGAHCHAMQHDGRIVAYCWTFDKEYVLTFDEYWRKNIVFTLDADAVFMGNVFVAPGHRHHGVFSRLFYRTLSRYPGNIQFYSWVEHTNDVSLQAHAHLGFVPRFRILCVTICGVTGYWVRTVSDKTWHHALPEKLGKLNLHRPGAHASYQHPA